MVKTRRAMVRSALFTALISSSAIFFRVSSGIVPFSLVPLMVVLGGLLLEPDEAFTGVLLYIIVGLAGFPVFAAPPFGGPMYVLQPTFGFVLGFLVSAPLLALMIRHSRRLDPFRVTLMSIGAMGMLYLPGLLYLWLILNRVLGMEAGIGRVFAVGFWPFIGPDLFKAFLASLLAWRVQRLQWIRGLHLNQPQEYKQ